MHAHAWTAPPLNTSPPRRRTKGALFQPLPSCFPCLDPSPPNCPLFSHLIAPLLHLCTTVTSATAHASISASALDQQRRRSVQRRRRGGGAARDLAQHAAPLASPQQLLCSQNRPAASHALQLPTLAAASARLPARRCMLLAWGPASLSSRPQAVHRRPQRAVKPAAMSKRQAGGPATRPPGEPATAGEPAGPPPPSPVDQAAAAAAARPLPVPPADTSRAALEGAVRWLPGSLQPVAMLFVSGPAARWPVGRPLLCASCLLRRGWVHPAGCRSGGALCRSALPRRRGLCCCRQRTWATACLCGRAQCCSGARVGCGSGWAARGQA